MAPLTCVVLSISGMSASIEIERIPIRYDPNLDLSILYPNKPKIINIMLTTLATLLLAGSALASPILTSSKWKRAALNDMDFQIINLARNLESLGLYNLPPFEN